MKIRKAVFPVGGLGTRFLPVTKSLPKEMLPVHNKPLIQHAFEEACEAGIEEFIFITGRNKNALNNHFDHAYELQHVLSKTQKQRELELTTSWLPKAGSIIFVRQQEPLGLGHAVWCARHVVGNEPFAVILADELLYTPKGFLKEMIEVYNQTLGNIIGLSQVQQNEVSSYGVVALKEEGKYQRIIDMVEKPEIAEAPSNYVVAGRYILGPEIFKAIENTAAGRNQEVQLTDAMKSLLESQKFYGAIFNGPRYDCGNYLGFLEANIAYAMKDKLYAAKLHKFLQQYNQ